MSIKRSLSALVLVLALVLPACSFGPPASCGDEIGGTADTARFDQYFTRMALVNSASGESGPEGDSGLQFSASDSLDIRADSDVDVAVRVCIQSLSGGPIAFDGTQTFTQGASGINLGSFEAGNYVVRVIVDGVLVKNFPFEIK